MSAKAAEKNESADTSKTPKPGVQSKKKEATVSINLEQLDKEELELQQKLEAIKAKKAQALAEAASEIYAEVRELLTKFGSSFTTEQKKTLAHMLGIDSTSKKAPKTASRSEVVPKYRLPTGEEWSGRGRTPLAFLSWAESAEGKELAKKFEEGKVSAKYPLIQN